MYPEKPPSRLKLSEF